MNPSIILTLWFAFFFWHYDGVYVPPQQLNRRLFHSLRIFYSIEMSVFRFREFRANETSEIMIAIPIIMIRRTAR